MQFSKNWLYQWCSPNLTTEELSSVLTMGGLEVEQISPVANNFNNIIIAQVLQVEQHPNADKLKVCKVKTIVDGIEQNLQIVCGASNVESGIKVPCAMVGAVLNFPDEDNDGKTKQLTIKNSKLRGIESQGMLCSRQELGLEKISQGILILPFDAPLGQSIRTYLDLNDDILTIKLTPNRADCLSIMGIARDLSALTNTPLNQNNLNIANIANNKGKFHTNKQVTIVKDAVYNLCPKFISREIKDINAAAPTPEFMKNCLIRSGLRSVNILVDISNYVMLELGQPSHIFDADVLGNNIQVNFSNNSKFKEQKIELLNNNHATLNINTGIISDENFVQAMAGVMGGAKTAVNLNTKNIFIECAHWLPEAIAGKSKHYKLTSDAAYRFERGVDPELPNIAIERITDLIIKYCGHENTQVSYIQINPEKQNNDNNHENECEYGSSKFQLRLSKIYQISGLSPCKLSTKLIINYLERLNLQPKLQNDSILEITTPSYRFDLKIAEDIIEEIIRLHGFDNLDDRAPQSTFYISNDSTHNSAHVSKHEFRHKLAALGYNEIINFGFTSTNLEQDFSIQASDLNLLNPIASQYNTMRSSLIGGLIEKLIYNQQQGASNISTFRLFEVGNVFGEEFKHNYHQYQKTCISGVVNGLAQPLQWASDKLEADFYSVKGDLQKLLYSYNISFGNYIHPACHPNRCAAIYLNTNNVINGNDSFENSEFIGFIAELHPNLSNKYGIKGTSIIFELNYDVLKTLPKKVIQNINKFPSVKRDIAVIVKQNINAEQLIHQLQQMVYNQEWPQQTKILDIRIFDIFKPTHDNKINNANISHDEKSIAFQFYLQKQNATLNEQELTTIMQLAIKALEKYGTVRSK